MRHLGVWGLGACAGAVGGAAVWALAEAARVGWLRALLDLYPRSSWDRVTWVLIPVLVVLPLVIQGTTAAWLSAARPVPAGRGVVGSTAGSVVALGALGLALFAARRLPALAGSAAAGTLPVFLVLGWGVLFVSGGLAVVSQSSDRPWLRRAAVPAALAITGIAWIFAREWILSAAAVLDQLEVVAYFIAVAGGGGVGSAWSTRASLHGNLTGVERGRYNVPS